MTRGENIAHRIAAALLAVLLGSGIPALAVSKEEIAELREKAESIAAERAEHQEMVAVLSDGIAVHLAEKVRLDGEIAVLEEEIDALQEEIDAFEERIAQTETELADAREREAAKYELFCQRVRVMEGQGRMTFWSVIFRSTSFTDLLTRLDLYNEIMVSDQQVIDDLRALQEEIAEKEAALEEDKAGREAARSEAEDKRAELDAQRETANALVLQLQEDKDAEEAVMDDLSAAEEEVMAEVVRLSRELAAQEAAAAMRSSLAVDYDHYSYSVTEAAALGGYAWPVESRKINSFFGRRSSPGGIGSTNHKGVDIGGVGYGTPIHAAKAGTVIVSQYHPSYGNYVVVSHGSGNTTLYAHMSRRAASVGDRVVQGSVLGFTGSTGQSTGPHLHFEIAEDGVRVDPLVYLTGWYR